MQMKDAELLQAEFQKSGKTCDHPRAEQEYYLSTTTGDWVCSVCGAGVGKRNYNDSGQRIG